VKKALFLGFTAMQVELAKKFVTYRKLQDTVQVMHEEYASGQVDACVINCDNAAAVARMSALVRSNPVPTLGVGTNKAPGLTRYVAGSFKPAAVDELAQLLTAQGSSVESAKVAAVSAPESSLANSTTTVSSSLVREKSASTSASVLVVDDSEVVRKTMVSKIGEYGHSVDVANDGAQALAMMTESKYKLVFLDVMMPGLDGFEVCKRIKKSAEHRSTSVFMLSSKDGMFDKVRGSMSGCNGYLVKPLENRQLRDVLEMNFNRRHSPDQPLPGGRRERDAFLLPNQSNYDSQSATQR
jgi:two-component system, cell cycle response regulator